jgi:hypothetical protein
MDANQIHEFTPHRCERTDVHTKFRLERKERELVHDKEVDGKKIFFFFSSQGKWHAVVSEIINIRVP